jgi:hypothetical protein
MKKKITLYLTDFGLHARKFRPATTLEKTIKKSSNGLDQGRIYTNHAIKTYPDGRFEIAIKLPEELQKQVDAGEVEVDFMMPKDGTPIFLGNDAIEKMAQLKKKERLKLARTSQTWKKV